MSIVVNRLFNELNQENRMQLFKITCGQCPHYGSCSQKTRMFVNYCGSRFSTVEKNVRAAISECRAKHGYMLQSVIFPPVAQTSGEKAIAAAHAAA
jgi:hypothetical protein